MPTEARFKAFRLAKDLTASDMAGFWEVTTLHAEGSLASQRMGILGAADLNRYREQARKVAEITPWEP